MLLLFLLVHFELGSTLSCIQCSRDEFYYSDWARQSCVYGRRPSIPCADPNHTICITDYHRSFDHWIYALMDSGAHERQIMRRRCGTTDEIYCNLFDLPRMHEINEETGFTEAWVSQKKRRTQRAPLVKVCSTTCNGRECHLEASSSSSTRIYILLVTLRLLFEVILII